MPKSYTPDLIKILKENGCIFVRNGKGDHQIWECPEGHRFVVDSAIPSRHWANGVLKQAGLKKAL